MKSSAMFCRSCQQTQKKVKLDKTAREDQSQPTCFASGSSLQLGSICASKSSIEVCILLMSRGTAAERRHCSLQTSQ
jgi:hypothetical protein